MSETPKFTPGPWKWWTSNSWRRLTAHNGPGGQYIREGDVLCPVKASDGHPDCSISQADMDLIAAAPELYEALKGFAAAIRAGMAATEGSEAEDIAADLSLAALEVADAALAKAEGRS
jgi:hypothetical protein